MRVAFIKKDPLPDPVVVSLAGVLTHGGHAGEVFVPGAEVGLAKAIGDFAPDVVLFTPHSGFEPWCIEQARALKRICDALVVFALPHPAEHQDPVQEDCVDLQILGDPEWTLADLLTRLAAGGEPEETTGTVASGSAAPARDPIADLDELPSGDYDVYRRYPWVRKLGTLRFAIGRGVVDNLHADSTLPSEELALLHQPARRHQPDEAVRRLQEQITCRRQTSRIAFVDDSITSSGDSGEWLTEFLDLYVLHVARPFSCSARADQLTPAVVHQLARAGCDLIRLGIICGDEGLRERSIGLPLPDSTIRAVAGRLRSAGIAIHTVSFIGLPGETFESAVKTLDLNLELRPAHAFAIPVLGGDQSPKTGRLQKLLPIAVDFPWSRRLVLRAIRRPRGAGFGTVFQLHHDLSTLFTGDLGRREVAGVALKMRNGR